MCEHTRLVRVEKNNGIQETLVSDVSMILGNCLDCGTTLTIAYKEGDKEAPIGTDRYEELRKKVMQ